MKIKEMMHVWFGQVDFHPGKLNTGLLVQMGKLR